MFRSLVIILMACAISCSSAPEVDVPGDIASLENLTVYSADTEPAYELSLTPEATFGDTDELFLGGWLEAEVDNNGRVFIADMQETKLHLYNPDGSYNHQINREGEGPGEYRRLGPMRTDDRFLHLMDRGLNRITRYDLETFEVAGETPLTLEQREGESYRYPQDFHLTNDEEYIVAAGSAYSAGATEEGWRSVDGLKMSWTGDFLSTKNLFSFDASEALVHRDGGAMRVMNVPYKRSSVLSFKNDKLIHGWNEHFLFSVYDENGEYQRAIYYPYQNMLLERDEILEMYDDRDEQWFSLVQSDDMPDRWPSWNTFTADDEGRIWVERLVDDPEETVLHVLSESGELLATTPWNTGNRIQSIKDGYLYSMEESDMGFSQLVKYAISME